MPVAPKPAKDIEIDLSKSQFSPEGDETRTVGGESVSGFIREGDDIPVEKKRTLARYLAKQTTANAYPVNGDSYREVSSNGPGGAPNFDRNPPPGQPVFASPQALAGYSNSGGAGSSEALKWVQDNLSKGKEEAPRTYDGNSLLQSTVGSPPGTHGKFEDPDNKDPITTGYVSEVLARNRFTPRSPLGRVGPTAPAVRYQNRFGEYDPNAPEVSQETLAKIGPLLTLRAAGEMGAEDTGFDPPETMNLKTILPGKAQLGITKIDTLVLEARSALEGIAGGVTDTGRLESDFMLNDLSYGQVNTYADPFSGVLPAGMSALAIALILAAQITLDAFTAVMGTITTANSTNSVYRDTLGRYIPGKSYSNKGQESGALSIPLPARLFGLEKTDHPYSDAVAKGLEVFFDVNLGRAVTEPGFFVVTLRTIMSSSTQLIRKIADIGRSGNPFTIVNSILGFVDAIRTSKLIGAMNVFAHIGDQALTMEANFPNGSDGGRVSTIDAVPSGLPGSAYVKSRDQGSLRLAWRNSTAPMTVLLPLSVRNAGATKKLSVHIASLNRAYGGDIDGYRTVYSAQGSSENKIPLEEMRKIESLMEAEYMPFYFHDMRTNELVAFHAFLTNLTDTFSVNHETVEAYGRVDPVKIYKNTVRQIGLSFIVAATNEDDFDYMWMKINKLLTLAYPQWSEGLVKHVPLNGDKFIQPFSQVPAASPVFRLRVGDVIKSNYSRFALKRIFGYGSSNFKSKNVDDQTLQQLDDSNVQAESDYRSAQERSESFGSGVAELDSIRLHDDYMLRPAPLTGYPQPGGAAGVSLSFGANKDTRLRNLAPVRVRVEKITRDNLVNVSLTTGETYVVTAADLIELKDDSAPEIKQTLADKNSDHSLEGTGGFFDPGGPMLSGPDANANTIVRSFESSMSKGLPCVLNSVNFNWLESTTWETEVFGGKAPKMCKIDLTITPFHDIAPGLDSSGFNRAPIYNVGQYANLLGDNDPQGEKQFETYRQKLWKK